MSGAGEFGPFTYRAGVLHAEELPLPELAASAGTPSYVYAASAMRARFRALRAALADLPALICYAVKANHNLAIIRLFAAEGAGADTVSGGEVRRALTAGVPPARIVFAGLAKTDDELRDALAAGIHQFNIESVPELQRLAELANAQGFGAPVALRVNPDVAAGGHDKISTGRKGDKFGIPLADIDTVAQLASSLPGIALVGLHVHIGSQITRLEAFEAAYRRVVTLFRELRASGLALRRLDLGGGFGIHDGEASGIEPSAYAAMLRRVLDGVDCEVILEPGRWLVAEAGLLLSAVVGTKSADGRRFVILDAGMNTLVRPALYGARHPVLPVRGPMSRDNAGRFDIVGPICESSDLFGRDYALPELGRGDLIAIMTAGAYGAVMASDYNSRPSPAEVLVEGGRSAIVRARRSVEAQMSGETVPDWLPAVLDPSGSRDEAR